MVKKNPLGSKKKKKNQNGLRGFYQPLVPEDSRKTMAKAVGPYTGRGVHSPT